MERWQDWGEGKWSIYVKEKDVFISEWIGLLEMDFFFSPEYPKDGRERWELTLKSMGLGCLSKSE